jgi:hypothetical protein
MEKTFEMLDGGQFNADKAYKDSKVNIPWTHQPAIII